MLNTQLQAAVLLALVQLVPAPAPAPYFDSYGPNQLFNEEGQNVKTTNGNKAMYGVTEHQCARDCDWMDSKCDCCNSFSYQPSSSTCYLKKRADNASDAHSYNAEGWQSYKFWGLSHDYSGNLYDVAMGWGISAPIGYSYTMSFVGKGPNQVAVYQGFTVKQASGVSVKECAELCLQEACDGFSYNPDQTGGMCYLKDYSTSGKYDTQYNSEGWTFYWLEVGTNKCYCPCASEFICITCKSDGTCVAD
eukprot:TRINITY_DN344_c1_g1_i3.p2 TRINITY_DN344_c1_g1~~TRINITY_DN344_c1_g1_i3.p2  ORF type:complete len:248 (+),score=12.76 TRINITY_DN344_c1_g1_i3:186-929(+)